MSRANLITTNFTAGEISPYMKGRVDTNKYANGAEIIENFIVKPQGGLVRRQGTYYAAAVKTSSAATILIPFRFSSVQSYVIEIGNLYVRFYKNGGRIESPPGTPIEVVTPWATADLAELQWAQSADQLYVTHPDYQTRMISRTSDTAWTIALYNPADGPYLDTNRDISLKVTYTPATDDSVVLDSDTAATFVLADEGTFVEFKVEGEWRLVTIKTGGFVNGTRVRGYVVPVKIGIDSLSTLRLTPIANQASAGKAALSDPSLNYGKLASRPASYQVAVTPTNRQVGVDPSATVTLGGATVTSSLSGTFTKYDVGKYIRLDTGAWRKITVYLTSATVTTTAVTMWAASAATWPAVNIKPTLRAVTLRVDASAALFTATDDNDLRWMRLNFSGFQVAGQIGTYTSSILGYMVISQNRWFDLPQDDKDPTRLPDDHPTDFRMGAWSTVTGWPHSITFHEQRLWFGGTDTQPQTIWSTESGDYNSMAPTAIDSSVLDTNAITYTIASGEVNVIEWMQSGPVLLIGTNGAEFQAKPSTIGEPLTPRNCMVIPQTPFGSSHNVGQKKVGSAVLFCERGGRKIRELTYDYTIDAFTAKDVTIIAEHILRDGTQASKLAYQQNPNSVLWVVRSDGQLAAMTYEREQEVVAWHRHSIGGSGIVESIAIIPDDTGNEDILYMIVRRTINGSTARYVEYMTATQFPANPPTAANRKAVMHLDCMLTYSGAPATTISGLSHLVAATVGVLADGIYIGTKVVNGSGQITLTTAASVVQVGFNFTSKLLTLGPEGGSIFGTSQGKVKRVNRAVLRLLNAVKFKHGRSLSNLLLENLDLPAVYFSGDIDVATDQGYTLADGYYIVVDEPYPLVLLAYMPMVATNQ